MLDETKLGRFRANPSGDPQNTLKLIDPTTPGTPATDANAVGIDASAATNWEGITYTGKTGGATFLPFFSIERSTGAKINKVVAVSEGNAALKAAIELVLGQHEVGPKVDVTGAVGAVIITHVGSGTLASVRLDGSDEALARVAF